MNSSKNSHLILKFLQKYMFICKTISDGWVVKPIKNYNSKFIFYKQNH